MPPEITRTLSTSLPPNAQLVFTGKIFKVYQWEQTLFDGSTALFERIVRSDSACIIAVTADKKIIITRQEQPAHRPFWGLLGGVVDGGETPQQAAIRELREEAGSEASVWKDWFSVVPSARVEWTLHGYIAQQVEQVATPQPDAGEKITLAYLSLDEFLDVIVRDDFRDSQVALEVLRTLHIDGGVKRLERLFFE